MANIYKDVIDFLSCNRDLEYKDIACSIAVSNPKIFMEAVKKIQLNNHPWKETVLAYKEKGEKLEAIKVWRRETGLGLNEAKEAVEEYWRQN